MKDEGKNRVKSQVRGRPFIGRGDPRNNLKGRPPLSEEQKAFRQALQERGPKLLALLDAILRDGAARPGDASVVNKMLDKLTGKEPGETNVNLSLEELLDAEPKR